MPLSVYHKGIKLIVSFSIWIQAISLMDFLVLKSSTIDHHISDSGEVNLPQRIRVCFTVRAKFPDRYAEDTFYVHPGIKIAKLNFGIVAGAALIKGILGYVVLLLRRSVSANQRCLKKIRFAAVCCERFIRRSECQNSATESLFINPTPHLHFFRPCPVLGTSWTALMSAFTLKRL